ncbi:MAG: hypothetical protein M5T61_19905 [Acidimicrobiia bacterium]|nr:hypothetical protein [Acidimicrobiia bacterium]
MFEKLGFLRTYLDKKHQQRYTIEPTSLVGQEVFERISRHGGVDELLALSARARCSSRSPTCSSSRPIFGRSAQS